MMACINPIIFRLLPTIKDKYDESHHQGMFSNDGISDRLILKILPEDYNAANPINKEVKLGYSSSIASVAKNLYQFEAVDKDRRSAVFRYILRDLLNAGGNLSLYGVTTETSSCGEPLVAVEDYHELDEYEDEQLGFTLRVGVLNVESLKGSYRKSGTNHNYSQGCRVIFTQTHKIVNGSLIGYVPTT